MIRQAVAGVAPKTANAEIERRVAQPWELQAIAAVPLSDCGRIMSLCFADELVTGEASECLEPSGEVLGLDELAARP